MSVTYRERDKANVAKCWQLVNLGRGYKGTSLSIFV